MTDTELAYSRGYEDGESSQLADWMLALDDLLPDDVECRPSAVAEWIRRTLLEAGDLGGLFARLSAGSIAWSVERNEHRLVYEPVAEYVLNHPLGIDEDDIAPDDLAEALRTDEFYEVRAYPTTPVGFVEVYGPDLSATVRRLVDGLDAERAEKSS